MGLDLRENIRMAMEGLRANKMRSLLTMLGIIIGIGSVIGILTVGEGLSSTITGGDGRPGRPEYLRVFPGARRRLRRQPPGFHDLPLD